jgi:two-component sensor histidine kinase
MPKKTETNADATLSRVLQYQRALVAFSRIVSEAMPTDRLLHHVCAHVSGVMRIKHTKVLHYRPGTGDLLIVAGVGWKPGVVGTVTLPLDNASPPGRAVQTGAPVIIDDLPHDPEFRLEPILRDHGIVSVLNVPVTMGGRPWGVLEVDAETPHCFDERDVDFLATCAHMLGTAMAWSDAEQRVLAASQARIESDAVWTALIRELQHRVKNSWQIIISFLSLQRRKADSPAGRQAFTSVMERVHAISLAHDLLSPEQGISEVEFADYLHSLCTNIDPRNGNVTVMVDAAAATLPLDRAVPAGLIVNELVTNAFKYAFDEGQPGRIAVQFTTQPDTSEACITVEDDGKGMGPQREGGLGLSLVDAFTRQLNGRLERDPVEKGTRTRLCFPLAS